MKSPLADSRARIDKFEAFHGLRLPDDYRAFLLQTPAPEGGRLPNKKGKAVIERFLPLLEDPKGDAVRGVYDIAVVISQLDARLTDDANQEDIILVPIAEMFAGDFLVLDYRRSKEAPEVAIWDHESSEDFAPATYPVSNTFSEFLELLSNRAGDSP